MLRTIGGLLIAIETILTYVFTYQLIHVYEKLIRIAIIASLAMFGKPCIFRLCHVCRYSMFFDNVFIVFYTLLASSGSVKYIELYMRS